MKISFQPYVVAQLLVNVQLLEMENALPEYMYLSAPHTSTFVVFAAAQVCHPGAALRQIEQSTPLCKMIIDFPVASVAYMFFELLAQS